MESLIVKCLTCGHTDCKSLLPREKNNKRWRSTTNLCAHCGICLGHYKNKKYGPFRCFDCAKKLRILPVLVCKECGGKISTTSYSHSKLCRKCYSKLTTGSNNPRWSGGREYCVDCGKKLKTGIGESVTKRCRKCYDIFRVERDQRTICIGCGGTVHYSSRSKLCRTCWLVKNAKEQKIKYACAVCGKERSPYAKVCSDCFVHPSGPAAWNWKGGKATYSGLWDVNKMKALKRDNFTCQICFKYGIKLNVHHIVFLSNFMATEMDKAHDLSNLVTLCMGCHNSLHDRGKQISIDKLLFPWLEVKNRS